MGYEPQPSELIAHRMQPGWCGCLQRRDVSSDFERHGDHFRFRLLPRHVRLLFVMVGADPSAIEMRLGANTQPGQADDPTTLCYGQDLCPVDTDSNGAFGS